MKKAQNIMKRKENAWILTKKAGIPAFSWKFSCLYHHRPTNHEYRQNPEYPHSLKIWLKIAILTTPDRQMMNFWKIQTKHLQKILLTLSLTSCNIDINWLELITK